MRLFRKKPQIDLKENKKSKVFQICRFLYKLCTISEAFQGLECVKRSKTKKFFCSTPFWEKSCSGLLQGFLKKYTHISDHWEDANVKYFYRIFVQFFMKVSKLEGKLSSEQKT